MNPTQVKVRAATREDVPAILEIYNEAVLHTTASYDLEPRSLEHRLGWLAEHVRDGFPVLVAETEGQVVGWASLSRFHDRYGYRYTVENSIYVAPDARGRGIGGCLLGPLLEAAEARGFHSVIALVDASNEASLRLHRRFGFETAGRLREVGNKFDRWLDVVYLQRLFGGGKSGGGKPVSNEGMGNASP